jgi:transposase
MRREQLIESLTKQISEVETELDTALALDPEWAASATRLQTIPGIGPLTAAWLVVTTLNFTLCKTVAEEPNLGTICIWDDPENHNECR